MKTKHLVILPVSLLTLTILSATLLSSIIVNAEGDSATDTLNVTVNTACTLSSSLGTTTGVTGSTDGNGNNTYSVTVNPNTTKEINGSILSTVCNDSAGYSLYAIGYSGNSYDSATHTKLIGTNANIDTATSGANSYWAMKLAAVTTPTAITPPTILNSFDNWHVVPDTYTQIAKYTSTTASSTATGSTVQANYKIFISASQAADTYQGKVKYTMVHPNTAPAPTPPSICDTETCMQDMTLSQCQQNVGTGGNPTNVGDNITVYDKRDESDYTVRYINGTCWMTQNLRITGTVSATDSNFTTSSYSGTGSINLLDGGDLRGTTANVTKPQSHVADDTDVSNSSASGYTFTAKQLGAWYNLCAATAGDICSNNSSTSSQDICPSGWKLPTNSDQNAMYNTISSTPGLFNPVGGGRYNNGTASTGRYGAWFPNNSEFKGVNGAGYDASTNTFTATMFSTSNIHEVGIYVRCIKSS